MRILYTIVVSLLLTNALFAQLPTSQSFSIQSQVSMASAVTIRNEFRDIESVSIDDDVIESKSSSALTAPVTRGSSLSASFVSPPEVCLNTPVMLISTSTGNVVSLVYEVIAPDGSSFSSTQDPFTFTPVMQGPYEITLTVSNAVGQSDQTSPWVLFVIDGGEANLTYSDSGQDVSFFGEVYPILLGTQPTFSWFFGDGISSTEQFPFHTYSAPGTYLVELYTFNGCGGDTISQAVRVGLPPLPPVITRSPTADVCAGTPVTYTASVNGNVTSIDWDLPGSSNPFATGQTVTVVYPQSGVFDASVLVCNQIGCDTTVSLSEVSVLAGPNPGFSASVNGLSVTITDASTNADSYFYDFGDGNTSTDSNPTHTYTTGGTYTVSQTVTNTCGSDTLAAPVTTASNISASFVSPQEVCLYTPVTLVSTSTGNIDSLVYEVIAPDGSSFSSTQDPFTFTPIIPGVYEISLAVSNAAGQFDQTSPQAIVVFDEAIATMTYTVAGQDVSFFGEVYPVLPNGQSVFYWDFGDGALSTEQYPFHTYTASGTYLVELYAYNGCGGDTIYQNITVGGAPPSTTITRSPTADVCAGTPVTYTASVNGNVTSIDWDLPGSSNPFATGQTVTVVYPQSGVFDASVLVCNQIGCDTTVSLSEVSVLAGPNPGFSASVNGLSVTITDASTSADSYFYDFGDGNTSTDSNPTHTYTTGGTYMVSQTVTNSCGSDTLAAPVTTASNLSASFVSPSEVCLYAPVTLVSTSTGNIDSLVYEVIAPDGSSFSSTQDPFTFTPIIPGVYEISLAVSNAAGQFDQTSPQAIVVFDEAIATMTYTVAGQDVSFFGEVYPVLPNAQSVFYWDFGDGLTSNEQYPFHTYTASGTYLVELYAYNGCGGDTIYQNITVGGLPPSATITRSPTADVCAGTPVTYTASVNGNVTSIDWDLPGSSNPFATGQTVTVVYPQSGVFDASVLVCNQIGCDTTVSLSEVSVLAGPNPGFSASVNGLSVTITDASTNADSYFYDFGDGNTSTDSNPTHTYTTGGTYTVSQTVTNSCGSDTLAAPVTTASNLSASFVSPSEVCLYAPVTLVSTSTGNIDSLVYEVIAPDGSSFSSTQDPFTFTPIIPGVYEISLAVSNAAGQFDQTSPQAIVVFDEAIATMTYTVAGQDVSFFGEVYPVLPNGQSVFYWDFGDGALSTEQYPFHTYTASGTYLVELYAYNGCGGDTIYQNITVGGAPPSTTITRSPTADVCAGTPVTYTASVNGNPTSIDWDLPGSSNPFATGQTVTVVYPQSGVFDASVLVCNQIGCDTTVSLSEVSVLAGPIAGFSAVTQGALEVQITNTSSNGDAYVYDFGDALSSTDENPIHTYTSSGTYTVVQTVIGQCGNDTTASTLTVGQVPVASFSSSATGGFVCENDVVNYTSTSVDADTWLWSFPGGNPSTSTDENPQVLYAVAGIYGVSLTVTNAFGVDSIVMTDHILIDHIPQAEFNSDVNGLNVTFNDLSANATQVLWDFGDGNNSTDLNPSHTYTAAGTYLVSLEAINNCGVDQISASVNVFDIPEASFTNTTPQGCAPLSVTFDASGSSTGSLIWHFPGGQPSTSTEVFPTVLYDVAGNYDVSLTVTDAAGVSDSIVKRELIFVEIEPVALFTSNVNGLTATFANQSVGGTSYSWDFGDGTTSVDVSTTHTYAIAGTYTVGLTASNQCGTMVFVDTITVTPVSAPPIAAFTQSDIFGCAPLTVIYDASISSDIGTVFWSFPGGFPSTSTEIAPVVVYDIAGTYGAELTVTNQLGSDSIFKADLINVAELPVAEFDANVSVFTVNFTSFSSNANSHFWDFGNGVTSNEVNPTMAYTLAGTYTVTLTVSNDCGENVTTQVISVADGIPSAEFSFNVTEGCSPLEVILTDNTSGNPTAWAWTVSSNTGANFASTDQNPVFLLDEAGLYTFTLQVNNDAGSTTKVRADVVTVIAEPTAKAEVVSMNNSTVMFEATLTGADSYLWDFGDGNTSTIKDPLHTYATNGDYHVSLFASNQCGAVSDSMDVSIVLSGIGELPEGATFNMFPNPTSGSVTWNLQGVPFEKIDLSILDVLGREIYQERLGAASAFRQNLSLENFTPGVYVVRLKADSYDHQVRVVKQ